MTAAHVATAADAIAPIMLGGRTFRLATVYTFANDLYVSRELAASGLADTFRSLASAPELDRQRAAALVASFMSGRLCALLAGLLHEDGVKWSPATALEAEQFFADRTDPGEKEALLGSLVVKIASFFLNGLGSSPTFQSSLPPAAAAPRPPKPRRRRTAVPSTSAHGTRSS